MLDATKIAELVAAGSTKRWRAALRLAAYAGLRLGEVRALTWADIDLDAGTVTVRHSMLPEGTAKGPKTDAGSRMVPLLPALRRLLIAWKARAPHTRPDDLVIATANGKTVSERNLRRALDNAKTATGLDQLDARLSMHSLRHSFASMLATDLELPATTLAKLSVTPTPDSRCGGTPATAGTPRPRWRRCWPARPWRGSS